MHKDHPLLAESLSYLGRGLFYQESYEEALDCHKEAFEIRKKAFGEDHPQTIKDLHEIGSTLAALTQYERALQYYQRAIALCKENPEAIQELMVSLKRNLNICAKTVMIQPISPSEKSHVLGDLYSKYSTRDLALFKHTISSGQLFIAGHGPSLKDSPSSAETQGSAVDVFRRQKTLGLYWRRRGDDSQAITYLEKAITVYDRFPESLKEHEVANALNAAGDIYRVLKRYKKSFNYLIKALGIKSKIDPKPHFEIAKMLNSLGDLHLAKGNFHLARLSFEQALAETQKSAGGAGLVEQIKRNLDRIPPEEDLSA